MSGPEVADDRVGGHRPRRARADGADAAKCSTRTRGRQVHPAEPIVRDRREAGAVHVLPRGLGAHLRHRGPARAALHLAGAGQLAALAVAPGRAVVLVLQARAPRRPRAGLARRPSCRGGRAGSAIWGRRSGRARGLARRAVAVEPEPQPDAGGAPLDQAAHVTGVVDARHVVAGLLAVESQSKRVAVAWRIGRLSPRRRPPRREGRRARPRGR